MPRLAGEQAVHHEPEPDGADRLVRAAAARPGDPRHGDAHLRTRMPHGAERHGPGDDFAHGAMRGDQRRIDAEQFGLGFVGVGHEAAFEPVARSGEVGAGRGDHPAGAAFGGGQLPALVLQRLSELRHVVHDQNLHAAMTSKAHSAATKSSKMMPKPPRQPKPWNSSSAQATGPGFTASKRRNSAKAANWPARPVGMTSHSTIQKAITSSHTMAPGSSTRMCAAVTVQAHQ